MVVVNGTAEGDDRWSGTVVFSIVIEDVVVISAQDREDGIAQANREISRKIHDICRLHKMNVEKIDIVRTEGCGEE